MPSRIIPLPADANPDPPVAALPQAGSGKRRELKYRTPLERLRAYTGSRQYLDMPSEERRSAYERFSRLDAFSQEESLTKGQTPLDLSEGGTGAGGFVGRALDVYQTDAIEPLAARATYGVQKSFIPGTQTVERKVDEGQNTTEAYRTTDLPFAVKGLTELAVDPLNLLGAGAASKSAKLRGVAKNILIAEKTDIATPPAPAVNKLTMLIKAAKPARAETEALKSAELSQRVAVARKIAQEGSAESAGMRSTAALKGQLPKATFTPPRSGLTPDDVDSLFSLNRDKWLNSKYFTFLNTEKALSTLLTGQIPTQGEITLLENTFGSGLARAVMGRRSLSTKVFDEFAAVINLPRAVVASVDISAPMRQGWMLAGAHKKDFLGGFVPMFKAFGSERFAQNVDDAIRASPRFLEAENAKLYMAPLKGINANLASKEEAFMSRWADRIGILRMSNRAYMTYLNKLRFDVFDNTLKNWEKAGKKFAQGEVDDLADFINKASGRGEFALIGRRMDDLAPILNATFFSPRLVLSRVQAPLLVFTARGAARKEAAKTLAGFVGSGIGILSMLKLSGAADVELDPRSSDFGKVRIGPVRYDFWAGEQPIARYVAQMITGKRKAISSGEIQDVSRKDTVLRFFRSKAAPLPSLAWDYLKGENFFGEAVGPGFDAGLQEETIRTILPIFVQDIYEAVQEEGMIGGLKVIPSGLGVGTGSFYPTGESFADTERERLISEIPDKGINQKRQEALRQASRQEQRTFRESEVTTARQLDERALKTATGARKQTLTIKLERLDNEKGLEAELTGRTISRTDFRKRFDKIQADSAKSSKQVFTDFNMKEGKPPEDPNERAVYDYYRAYEQSEIPGGLDFDKLETLLASMDGRWTDEQKEYVSEQTGQTEHHTPLARQITADKKALRDSGYWNVQDRLPILRIPQIRAQYEEYLRTDAVQFGLRNGGQALSLMRRVDRQKTQAREQMRTASPELDALLIRWGYVTKPKTAKGKLELLRNAGLIQE